MGEGGEAEARQWAAAPVVLLCLLRHAQRGGIGGGEGSEGAGAAQGLRCRAIGSFQSMLVGGAGRCARVKCCWWLV